MSTAEGDFPSPGKETTGAKLNLGCANIAPWGWINLDGSWNAWVAAHPFLRRAIRALKVLPPEQLSIAWPGNIRTHDVRRGLPYPADSFTAVYASHLLEHLYLEEARQVLRECFRVLVPGGILRLVVPDLETLAREYLEERKFQEGTGDCPADRLCLRLDMRPPRPARGHFLYRLYSTVKDFHTHKWMYDRESLGRRMAEAGFVSISPKAFLESAIPAIEEVERRERFDQHRGICLEGRKPLAAAVSR